MELDGRIELSVEDDGCGFVMRPSAPGKERSLAGIGLASMRERMLLVGGDIRVSTLVGAGTVVRAVLHLSATRS